MFLNPVQKAYERKMKPNAFMSYERLDSEVINLGNFLEAPCLLDQYGRKVLATRK